MGYESDLSDLICDGGFPDENSLVSFCMSVGVFHNRKLKENRIPFGLKVEDLSSYEVCSLVLNDQSIKDIDLKKMNRTLEEHLLGGVEMIIEETRGASGLESLQRLTKLIPP